MGKVYKRKSSLTRHLLSKHELIELLKLILNNENLGLHMQFYTDQSKFLKMIFIQEHTLRAHGRSTTRPSGTTIRGKKLPRIHVPSIE